LLYFTHLPRIAQWVDLYQIWYRRSPRGPNQLCWVFCRLVQRYWFCRGLKFAYPHRNWRSPLTLSELPLRLWLYRPIIMHWLEKKFCLTDKFRFRGFFFIEFWFHAIELTLYFIHRLNNTQTTTPGPHPLAKFHHCGFKNVGLLTPKLSTFVLFDINSNSNNNNKWPCVQIEHLQQHQHRSVNCKR